MLAQRAGRCRATCLTHHGARFRPLLPAKCPFQQREVVHVKHAQDEHPQLRCGRFALSPALGVRVEQDGAMVAEKTRVERYLAHLDSLSGGVEPEFWPVESTFPGHNGITAIGYRDLPDHGLFLGMTYGLSLSHQEAWRAGRPELSICVKSQDPAWALAIAYLAERLRHVSIQLRQHHQLRRCHFVRVGDGRLRCLRAHRSRPRRCSLDVGDELPIHIVGMYPTYASERQLIVKHGLEAFWQKQWDPYDATRPPVS